MGTRSRYRAAPGLVCALLALPGCGIITGKIRYDNPSFGSYTQLPTLSGKTYFVQQNSSNVTMPVLPSGVSTSGLTITVNSSGTHGSVSVSNGDVVYKPANSYTGVDTFQYVVNNGQSQVSTSVQINVMGSYTWTGNAGDGLWSTAANWCGSVKSDYSGCQGAVTAPRSSDVAIFDQTCTSNCSAAIDSSISIAGLELNFGWNGTLTQNSAQTVTLGSTGFTEGSGSFTGSDAAITVNGPWSLSGGSFTSTSNILTVVGNFSVSNNPTFSINGGSAVFSTNGTPTTITPGNIQLQNVSVTGGDTQTFSGTMTILGNLTIDKTGGDFQGGTWTVSGNVNVTNAPGTSPTTLLDLVGSTQQKITGSGGILGPLENDSTYSSGYDYFEGSVTVAGDYTDSVAAKLQGDTGSTVTFSTLSIQFAQITINGTCPTFDNITFAGAGAEMGGCFTFDGALTFAKTGAQLQNANLYAGSSSASINATTGVGAGQNAITDQIWDNGHSVPITGSAGSFFPDLYLQGNDTFSGTINLADGMDLLSTSLNTGGKTFNLYGGRLVGWGTSIPFAMNVVIAGGAYLEDMDVNGNVSVAGSTDSIELLAGSTNITGTLSLNGSTLTKNSQTLTVGGTTVGTGSLYGGTVDP